MWELIYNEDKTQVKSVRYLSTLTKHTQAVNVVRFDPKGDTLATAGDDGTVLLWQLSDTIVKDFETDADDLADVQESWIVKHACRSSTSEIYDLAWSPDSKYILTGLMDNVTRIYNAHTGQCVKELAEHNHYVQGVCWDPKNEFLATQSADRSVHVYSLRGKHNNADGSGGNLGSGGSVSDRDGEFSISPTIFYKISRAELRVGRDGGSDDGSGSRSGNSSTIASSNDKAGDDGVHSKDGSPLIRTPKASKIVSTTPSPKLGHARMFGSATKTAADNANYASHNNHETKMNPPSSHRKRRLSSASSSSSSAVNSVSSLAAATRSVSPSPPVGLPAVRPIEGHPNQQLLRSSLLYHNETLQSFFRRLAFSIDGSLLLTPSGIFKHIGEDNKEETRNTVYVYTRAGLNSPPVCHLPGLKKPAVAISFAPQRYKLKKFGMVGLLLWLKVPAKIGIRKGEKVELSLDGENDTTIALSTEDDTKVAGAASNATPHQQPIQSVFTLPYRMMFAVATQDTIILYDTQQLQPLGLVSNLHYSAFTDVAWLSDGKTLIISSTDGFCSVVNLSGELVGEVYVEAAMLLQKSGSKRQSILSQLLPQKTESNASGDDSNEGIGEKVSDIDADNLKTKKEKEIETVKDVQASENKSRSNENNTKDTFMDKDQGKKKKRRIVPTVVDSK